MTSAVASVAAAAVHPLMQVTFDQAAKAARHEGGLWDAFAMWAGTEERAALDEKGLTRAIKAQTELYGASIKKDFDPNECSTYRVYRKLLGTARKLGVPVTAETQEEGKTVTSARSVGDVRKDVKAARDAEKADAEQAEGAGEGEGKPEGTKAIGFDDLTPLQQVEAASKLIREALAKASVVERDAARIIVAQLAVDVAAS